MPIAFLRFETIAEKKLVGKRVSTSIAADRTFELWSGFMPRRNEINNRVSANLISMQVYNPAFSFSTFSTHTVFEKWACAEVTGFDALPNGMEAFTLPQGLYAVFLYRGRPADFGPAFNYIFNEWLPGSAYQLDNRPHFEVLGAGYKNNQPDSEEEIFIPVSPRN